MIKKAIQELSRLGGSKAKFNNLADYAPIMVWMTEPDGSCIYLSQSWYEFSGQTPETGLGFGWLQAVHPDDRQHTKQIFLEANKNHEAFRLEYRLFSKDGSLHWAIDTARPRFSNNGRFLGFIGSVVDITERKQAEEALRLSEEKYRTLFDSIDEGFCIIEMLFDESGKPIDYRFLETNAAFEQHTGITNAIGKRIRDIVPKHEEHWFKIYGEVALKGKAIRFENAAEQLGFYYDVYAFRVGEPEQRQVAVLFKDISRRRRYEEYTSLLYKLALDLSTALSQQELIAIIQRAVKDFGATRGAVIVIPDDKMHLEVIGSFGFDAETMSNWDPVVLDHPTNPIAHAVRESTALWLPKLDVIDPGERSTPPKAKALVTWGILPFNTQHMLSGALVLNFDQPTTFDKVERDFLMTLTENYSQALRRTHLNEKLQQLATLTERQRLSRDLHDSVQQLLFSSINLASALPRLLQKNPEQAEKMSHELVSLNQAALAEMHTLLHELRSDSLIQTPFIKLLNNLSLGLKGHKSVNVNMNCDVPQELILPEEIQIAMYRIAQEALHNIAKHSQAGHVEIECSYHGDEFRLMIRDDGDGFDMNHVSGGFGLKTMRERAESVGASLEIESIIGVGTQLSIVAKGV